MKRLDVDFNRPVMIEYLERLRKEGFVRLVGIGEYEWVGLPTCEVNPSETMSFVDAVDLLNRGKAVRRRAWPKGVRVFKRAHPHCDVVKVDGFRPLLEEKWFPIMQDLDATDWEQYKVGGGK